MKEKKRDTKITRITVDFNDPKSFPKSTLNKQLLNATGEKEIAKQKAQDYVSVLGQKVGKALLITDNSQSYFPQPMYKGNMMAMATDGGAQRETLAVGELEINTNVSVTFALE